MSRSPRFVLVSVRDITYVHGDVTEMPENSLLLHVCNNRGGWGAGVVLAISKKWPEPELGYRDWYRRCRERGVLLPLGKTQFIPVAGAGKPRWVGNMVAQTLGETLLTGEIPLQYDKLIECLKSAAEFAEAWGLEIHAPRFGSDLAGGDWDVIETLIKLHIPEHIPVTIYIFP